MKRLLILCALCLPAASFAQSWSAGLRSGIGFYSGEQYLPYQGTEVEKVRSDNWEKEVFIRLDTKRLGFEAAFTRNAEQYNDVSYGICGTGLPETYQSGQMRNVSFSSLHLRVQYNLPGCPKMKRLQHSIGIAITPMLIESRNNPVYFNSTTSEYSMGTGSTWYRGGLAFGVEDLLRYRISKHFDAQFLWGYSYNGGAMLLHKGLGLQLGVGYRL